MSELNFKIDKQQVRALCPYCLSVFSSKDYKYTNALYNEVECSCPECLSKIILEVEPIDNNRLESLFYFLHKLEDLSKYKKDSEADTLYGALVGKNEVRKLDGLKTNDVKE